MALVFSEELGKEVTPEKATAAIKAKNNNAQAEKVQERVDQGVDRSSAQRTRTLTKGAKRSFIGGGASVTKDEVNNTDFLPSDTSQPEQKLPDYFRNGRQVNRTVTLPNGDTQTITNLEPIPNQVSSIRDNYTGVLSSIRLIDPTQLKNGNPSTGNPRQGQIIPENSKFFLESVQESHNEKYQIVETFNNFYVYFYGERPPVYNFSGTLLNLSNYNWKNEFMYFYQNFWRGSKAVELGARVFLTYDYQQIQGYILNINTSLQTLTDNAAQFSFSMLVTRRLFFNGTPDDNVIRDNLIPKTDTGFINTESNSFSQALATEYLEKNTKNSSSLTTLDANQTDKGSRILNESNLILEPFPNTATNPFSNYPAGEQRAQQLKRSVIG